MSSCSDKGRITLEKICARGLMDKAPDSGSGDCGFESRRAYIFMENSNFVSRGGIKLQAAIDHWKLKIENFVVLDVGSSTGGFVDCLLQNGASKVYAVDTAYGELAWKLRNDPRVVVMERTNILYLREFPVQNIPGESKPTPGMKMEDTSGVEKVDLITVDAGWTKLELVLPVVKKFLKEDGFIIALLKPHYEAPKNILNKGVVPDDLVLSIKNQVLSKIEELGFKVEKSIESPIRGSGGVGNKEYLLLITL